MDAGCSVHLGELESSDRHPTKSVTFGLAHRAITLRDLLTFRTGSVEASIGRRALPLRQELSNRWATLLCVAISWIDHIAIPLDGTFALCGRM